MSKDFERDELHAISRRARGRVREVENPNWIRAYEDLAHAANVLDAHIARSTIVVCETCNPPLTEGDVEEASESV